MTATVTLSRDPCLCADRAGAAGLHQERIGCLITVLVGGSDASLSFLPERSNLAGVRHILLVLSGKGGVGKSTISTELALSLRHSGKKVSEGLWDAELCLLLPDLQLGWVLLILYACVCVSCVGSIWILCAQTLFATAAQGVLFFLCLLDPGQVTAVHFPFIQETKNHPRFVVSFETEALRNDFAGLWCNTRSPCGVKWVS